MRHLALVLVPVVLVACRTKEPENPSLTAAGKKPCREMADHMVALMKPGGAEPGTVDAITGVLSERCFVDKWTQDAQRCFRALPSIEGSVDCAPLLTVEQRDLMEKAMEKALGGPPSGALGSGG